MCIMDHTRITPEEFVKATRDFVKISDRICDGWKIYDHEVDIHKSFIRKETYLDHREGLLKAEYVIFYNLSYGVPSFSFNLWRSSGVLLTLEDVRELSLIEISPKDFYSVITQQEHPVLCRPYFIVHPCHTSTLVETFRRRSKNIIVTFLSLITPLLRINLPLEYGV